MRTDYHYGMEAMKYASIDVPRILFEDKGFAGVTIESKLIYGLMLERMSLSSKNHWIDDEGRIYILYPIEQLQQDIRLSARTLTDSLKNLEDNGLIETIRQGQGRPTKIYVKRIISEQDNMEISEEKEASLENKNLDNHTSEISAPDSEVRNLNFKNTENRESRVPEINILEVYKPNANKTDINNNKYSENKSNHILSKDDEMDYDKEAAAYRKLIRENLSIDSLLERHTLDTEIIECMLDILLETVISRRNTIWVSKAEYPASVVKSKLLKFRESHIDYALECINENKNSIRNIKSYMLTTLFNAPSTMECHDLSKANYEMSEGRA